MDHKIPTNCRVCFSTNLKEYLDLGWMPLANKLTDVKNEAVSVYPLKVLFCDDCYLSQLSVVVDPEVLYSNYPYHSSVSQTFKLHCDEMAKKLNSMWKEPKKPEGWVGDYKYIPKVLDIAANDGCLLREFQRNGFGVVGVEPAKNLASNDTVLGRALDGELIPMYNDFWSDKLAQNIASGGNYFDFVVATNVLAHVDDLDDFLSGVERVLIDRGVFVVEVPYLPNLIKNNAFDTIYHEHLSYFLLHPLRMKYEQHGLTIIKVEQYPIHGGSIRIYAGKGNCITDPSVFAMERTEAEDGYYNFSTYENFKRQVEMVKTILKETMVSLKNSCKKVAGYGASAKGSTLLNYCGIIGSDLEYIVDDTEAKIGKYVGGVGIKIEPFVRFYENAPDYILLLAWNFSEEMKLKTKYVGAKYITPIPQVNIS